MDERTSVAATLQAEILESMPLADAMDIRIRRYTGDELEMTAPLAPNVNDKGCAFGGSLASLMTLAGWGLVRLALDARAGRVRAAPYDIYVQDSAIRYLAPVWQDFHALARLADASALPAFFDALDARGKARLRVHCSVPLADGSEAATLDAQFVALARADT